jgi:hypothetical protein
VDCVLFDILLEKISTAKIRLIHRFSTIGCHKYDGNGPSIVSKHGLVINLKQSCVNGSSMRASEVIANHPKNFVSPDANNWIAM